MKAVKRSSEVAIWLCTFCCGGVIRIFEDREFEEDGERGGRVPRWSWLGRHSWTILVALESLAFGSKLGPLGSPGGLDPVTWKFRCFSRLGIRPFYFLSFFLFLAFCDLIVREGFSIAQLSVAKDYNTTINLCHFDPGHENCRHLAWNFSPCGPKEYLKGIQNQRMAHFCTIECWEGESFQRVHNVQLFKYDEYTHVPDIPGLYGTGVPICTVQHLIQTVFWEYTLCSRPSTRILIVLGVTPFCSHTLS